MIATLGVSDIDTLTARITELGGTLPAELQAIRDTITAVTDWAPPAATDIASLARRGDLTADTAADVLDAALVQPNRNPADLKRTAKHELTQRFARSLQGAAGDSIIESIRPAFTKACAAIATAAETVPAGATAADLAEAPDEFIKAWRVLAEHKTTLEQVHSVIDLLVLHADVLGGPQPWHTPRALYAAFYVTDTGWLDRAGRALGAPNGTGGPRAGRWHNISSAIRLNTVSEARTVLAQAEQQHREHEAAEYAATHGVPAPAIRPGSTFAEV